MQKLFLLLLLSAFIAVCYAAPTKQEEELPAKVADILGAAAQEESQAKANFFPSNAAHASQLGSLIRSVDGPFLNRNSQATANQLSSWWALPNSQQDDGRNPIIDIATSILNGIRNNGKEDSDEANAERVSLTWSGRKELLNHNLLFFRRS